MLEIYKLTKTLSSPQKDPYALIKVAYTIYYTQKSRIDIMYFNV